MHVVSQRSEQSIHDLNVLANLLPNTVEPHYLIIFHDRPIAVPLSTGTAKTNTTSKAKIQENELRIRQLEQELAQSREDMRSITEDQEAANEELQSAIISWVNTQGSLAIFTTLRMPNSTCPPVSRARPAHNNRAGSA